MQNTCQIFEQRLDEKRVKILNEEQKIREVKTILNQIKVQLMARKKQDKWVGYHRIIKIKSLFQLFRGGSPSMDVWNKQTQVDVKSNRIEWFNQRRWHCQFRHLSGFRTNRLYNHYRAGFHTLTPFCLVRQTQSHRRTEAIPTKYCIRSGKRANFTPRKQSSSQTLGSNHVSWHISHQSSV